MNLRELERQVVAEEAVISNRFLVGIVERATIWRGGQGRYFLDVRVQTTRGEVLVENMPAVLGNYHEDNILANVLAQVGLGGSAVPAVATRGLISVGNRVIGALDNLFDFSSDILLRLWRYNIEASAFTTANVDTTFRAFLTAFSKHVTRGMRVLIYCPTGRPSEEAYFLGTISVQSGFSSFTTFRFFR